MKSRFLSRRGVTSWRDSYLWGMPIFTKQLLMLPFCTPACSSFTNECFIVESTQDISLELWFLFSKLNFSTFKNIIQSISCSLMEVFLCHDTRCKIRYWAQGFVTCYLLKMAKSVQKHCSNYHIWLFQQVHTIKHTAMQSPYANIYCRIGSFSIPAQSASVNKVRTI